MSATASQIKTGIKERLKTIPGLRAYDYQPDQPNPPMAWPTLDDVVYHGAMNGGNVVYKFTVSVIAGRASERSSQAFLDRLISYGGGIRAAIEGDPTLGDLVQDSICRSAGNILSVNANDTTYLTVDFQVEVYA